MLTIRLPFASDVRNTIFEKVFLPEVFDRLSVKLKTVRTVGSKWPFAWESKQYRRI